MVYVGDDVIKDVDAANQVGLHTVWLRPKNKPVEGESSPDEIINDIRELPGAIKKLVGR